jgi:ribosomal protein S18 acetylase RimI-like enzyme
MTDVRMLEPHDSAVLTNVAPDVFDNDIDPRWTAEFFADSRHHLAVAIDGEQVVGMASAVHYVHPDKAPELWINEVAVAQTHQRRGVGRRLVRMLLEHARALGCTEAWVLTDADNAKAQRMYRAAGASAAANQAIMFTFPLDDRTA